MRGSSVERDVIKPPVPMRKNIDGQQNNKTSNSSDVEITTKSSSRPAESEQPSKSGVISSRSNNLSNLSDKTTKAFSRLPALVKGYLTRRLMKTEKVMQKIETIRETTQVMTSLNNTPSKRKISQKDLNLYKSLINQLEKSGREFYDIFFNYPKSSQMALICRSREAIRDRKYRMGPVLYNSSYLTTTRGLNSSQTKPLSSATRVLEPKTRTFHPKRKRILSPKAIPSTSSTTVFRDTRNLPKKSSLRSLKHHNKSPLTFKRNVTFIQK